MAVTLVLNTQEGLLRQTGEELHNDIVYIDLTADNINQDPTTHRGSRILRDISQIQRRQSVVASQKIGRRSVKGIRSQPQTCTREISRERSRSNTRSRLRGRSHGHSRGRSRGNSRGHSRGRSRGNSRGHSRGRSRGNSRGHSRGRSRGNSRGHSRGRSRGNSRGHSRRRSRGNSRGHSRGRSRGNSRDRNQDQVRNPKNNYQNHCRCQKECNLARNTSGENRNYSRRTEKRKSI